MKLYFTCPHAKATFASDGYSLHRDHCIVENEKGEKGLQGTVSLDAGCPYCGELHLYAVKDVLCPTSRGKNEQ
jgi:hypothetical protein